MTVAIGATGEKAVMATIAATRRRAGGRLAHAVLLRVLTGVAVLLVVSFIVFWATSILPGDVVSTILGPRATADAIATLRDQLGLDKPVLVQYLDWLGGVLRGDFGQSIALHVPVADFFAPRVVSTAMLVLIATAITIPIAVTIGALAATRPRSWFDAATNIGSTALGAIPDFVIGLLLVLVFATGLMHLVPAVAISSPGWAVFDQPAALVLPVATLVLAMSPYLVRVTRTAVAESLQSEYVTAAVLRGVPRRRVVVRHALRNALSPIVHGSALLIGIALGGTAVVEFIFQYPGIGAGLVQAVSQRDLPTIQICALFFAAVWIAMNLVADIVAMALSPRRRGGVV